MSTADELAKLHALYTSGGLTQAEYEQAKARVLGSGGAAPSVDYAINQLRLSNSDKWLGGVCGGIAKVTGVDSWVWRIAFVLLAFFGGISLILYVLLWILVPREPA